LENYNLTKEHTFSISAYKESPYLKACVKSLLAQSVKTNIIICTSTPNSYIENIADDVQSSALIKLFETNDPITIIKVQQVLNYLEEVTDKAEEVAGVMSSIIIKYA